MISAFYSGMKRTLTQLGILPLSLWVILLFVNLTVLILPLGSIFFFRIYENQLIAETEAELIAQSVFIGEIYKREIRDQIKGKARENYGFVLDNPPPKASESFYTPLDPQLDLATGTIYPSRPDGLLPSIPPDETAVAAGLKLAEMLIEAQRTTLAGIRVLDFNGTVVAGRNENGLSFAHVVEVAGALSGQYASVIRQRISDEPPPVHSLNQPWYRDPHFYGLSDYFGRSFVGCGLSLTHTQKHPETYVCREKQGDPRGLSVLVLTLFIVLITSWTIARPIYRLIERTKKISAGDRQALLPLSLPGTKEMALLTHSFSDMARSLQERSSYIKDFATHVSHELKTPLTSIRGAAELLGDHFEEMTGEERQRFLTNIQDDSDRLKHLVSRLLELAQADSFTPSAETCDLLATLAPLAKKHQTSDFSINIPNNPSYDLDGIMVKMSAEVVEMIFTNLFDNAQKHGASEIVIAVEVLGDHVEIEINDDGNGISKANASKIFDPFFTTRRESGGTGIGLGIVRSSTREPSWFDQIRRQHKGSAIYTRAPSQLIE